MEIVHFWLAGARRKAVRVSRQKGFALVRVDDEEGKKATAEIASLDHLPSFAFHRQRIPVGTGCALVASDCANLRVEKIHIETERPIPFFTQDAAGQFLSHHSSVPTFAEKFDMRQPDLSRCLSQAGFTSVFTRKEFGAGI